MSLWRDVLDSYKPEKRAWDKRYPWLFFVLRPLSFPLTWLAAAAGLNANAVTAVTVILVLVASLLFSSGHFVAGSLFLIGFNLIDCVDGNLARMGRGTPIAGRFFDAMAGLPYWFFYLALGAGLARHPDLFMLSHNDALDSTRVLIFGGLATAGIIGSEWVGINFRNHLGSAWQDRKDGLISEKARGSSQGGSLTETLAYKAFINLTEIQAHDFALLLCCFAGVASLFLAASGVFLLLRMTLIYFHSIYRAYQLTR